MEQLAQRQHGTRDVQRTLRAPRRRQATPKAPRTVRAAARREDKPALSPGFEALLTMRIGELPPAIYERLATGGLQSAIVATMVGVTLFFHAPLLAALGTLLN
jgi:hypothetical protein